MSQAKCYLFLLEGVSRGKELWTWDEKIKVLSPPLAFTRVVLDISFNFFEAPFLSSVKRLPLRIARGTNE